MSAPLRLGVFIPARPDNHLQIADPKAAIGCLRPDIHAPLMDLLRGAEGITVVGDLDFRRALIHNGKVFCGDECISELNAFAWYCEVDRRPGSFDLEVLETLSRTTHVIRDPRNFSIGLDKYKAHLRLRDAGVRVADFVLFDHRCPARMEKVLEEWGAAVLKPRRGGWGSGVTAIDSPAMLRDVVDYVRSTAEKAPDHGYFLERFYENDLRRWASITMIDGEIMYGYRKLPSKHAALGRLGTKILDADEKGGAVELAELSPEHVKQANAAYRALGLGLIGFDMIWANDGPVIVDENTSPGNYASLYAQVGKDPAAKLAAWILREARSSARTNEKGR